MICTSVKIVHIQCLLKPVNVKNKHRKWDNIVVSTNLHTCAYVHVVVDLLCTLVVNVVARLCARLCFVLLLLLSMIYGEELWYLDMCSCTWCNTSACFYFPENSTYICILPKVLLLKIQMVAPFEMACTPNYITSCHVVDKINMSYAY